MAVASTLPVSPLFRGAASAPEPLFMAGMRVTPEALRASPLFRRYTDQDAAQLHTFWQGLARACEGQSITEAGYNAFLADMRQEDWPLRRPLAPFLPSCKMGSGPFSCGFVPY
jgi:hypothetical protein